ncbi:MAG: glycosyltransferase family 2 protein [Cycloclasticus sp.]|nr:glycosyltransferase family 2 protein [Cycloclasticus sp.]
MRDVHTDTVLIVIVNYKTAGLTIECLHSLLLERESVEFKVTVIDNDSQDGSYDTLLSAVDAQGWAQWVTVVQAEVNGGFSYGNNLAIRNFLAREFPPEYIYLLNPDTVVRKGAISSLVSFLDSHSAAGMVGSRLEDLDGAPQGSSFRFHTWLTELDRGFRWGFISKILNLQDANQAPNRATKTDWVAGASMLIRTDVFRQVGLLDESYFMYYEEMDFCLQAARCGWECWYEPNSRVVHYVGQSSGVTDTSVKAKRRPAYWFDSRRRFFVKNYGVLRACLADFAWLTGFSAWVVRNLIQKKTHNNPPHFLYDSLMNSVFVKGVGILPAKNK